MFVTSTYSAASTVCKRPERFKTWTEEVSAVYPPYEKAKVPEGPVADLIKESTRIPAWLFDKQTVLYQAFELLHPNQMLHLSPRNVANEEQPDEATSKDLVDALHHVMYVVTRHELLMGHNHHGKHNKSDLRQALDRLASHVWGEDVAAGQGYLFRSECALKLPKTQLVRIADATVDSVAFLFDPHNQDTLRRLNKKVRAGLTCMVEELPYLELVHWVMEYKKSESEEVQRQVYYGMVSSLWQRRALGRMDNFERKESQPPGKADAGELPLEPGNNEASAKKVAQEVHSVVKRNAGSGESMKSSTATKSEPQSARIGGSKLTPPLVLDPPEKEYQIVVYEIASYETLDPHDMIQYYLLMRASRKMADDYRREVFQDTVIQLKLKITDPSRYDWPLSREDRDASPSGLPSVDEEPNPTGDHQHVYVAEPQEEAGWMAQWDMERQIAMEKYGYGSLKGFSIHEPETGLDLDDRMLNYLSNL